MINELKTLIHDTLRFLQEEEWPENTFPSSQVEAKPKRPLNNWNLNPLPIPLETPPQFLSFFPSVPFHIPIRLVVTDTNQLLFLENVVRAITQYIAPAALFTGKLDALLTNQNVQLILAPYPLLKKRFPQIQLHRFLKFDGPTLLPYADHYNLELKHDLWKHLKSFRNLHPSS